MTKFDKIINRRNTNSLKWSVQDNELPMWIADMDFQTAPCVRKAMREKVQLGIFGYEDLPDEWFQAYQYWWKTRHGMEISKEWLQFSMGVLPAITSCVKSLTAPLEGVCVLTPAYNHFFTSIEDNFRRVVECPLSYNGKRYDINFAKLERTLSQSDVTLMIVCNPANPVGRVWSKEQLALIGEMCARYGVTVIADEIHCDVAEPKVGYVPFASASPICADISITMLSPSKTFNLAGMRSAAVMVPNQELREKVFRHLNYDEVTEPNSFAVTSAVAAFTEEGAVWLDSLRRYLSANRKFVRHFLAENTPQLTAVRQEATYLMWIDCSAITDDSSEFCEYLRKTTGLYLNCGTLYRGNGRHFIRLNIGCPRSTLDDGLNRLKRGVESYLAR